ncbi:CML24 [Symbiodinium pilosum]|uniref:CML24 protein n=1 Tax=Symbiodinium pilosum TaxID=2952 RepID=A0A812PFX1_SYMPI|nr:CML24 [Symbiodinium pilosum]
MSTSNLKGHTFTNRLLLTVVPSGMYMKHFTLQTMSNFPAGLGKGHDAAIVGSWLHSVFQNLDDGKIEESNREIVAVLKFTLNAAQSFWTEIYSHGMWMPRAAAVDCVAHGWHLLDPG